MVQGRPNFLLLWVSAKLHLSMHVVGVRKITFKHAPCNCMTFWQSRMPWYSLNTISQSTPFVILCAEPTSHLILSQCCITYTTG